MAQIPYRANLSTAIFPMTLARAGRSVIVPQADQNFDRRVDPDGEQKNAGIPQIIYGENIIPTVDGYQSVGYANGGTFGPDSSGLSWVPIVVNVSNTFKNLLILVGTGVAYSTTDGVTYTLMTVVGTAPVGPLNFVTTGTVRGVCYLHVGTRIYTVNSSGNTLTEVTATFTPGGILTNLIAICGAFNYLILLKSDGTVNWSSTTTPTDFTPSLVSGAGSGAIVGAAGTVQTLRQQPSGFYVYASGNVVAVTYTGNSRYPWRFTPVQNSEGALSTAHISGEPSDSENFMLSNSGSILQIDPATAQKVAPEISELLNKINYRDSFNSVTNAFTVVQSYLRPTKSLSYMMAKYITITDAEAGITYLYDIALKRYGKLKVTHSYVVDLEPTTNGDSRNLAFIDLVSGTTKIWNLDVNSLSIPHSGVMVLGKFQYARSRFLCLDEVSIESAQLPEFVPAVSRNFSVHAIPTLDGKTFQTAQLLYEVSDGSTGAVMSYYSTAEGKNVSLLIKGAFDLTSVEMLFHLGGDC